MKRHLLGLLLVAIALTGCKSKTETIVSEYIPTPLASGVKAIEVFDSSNAIVARHQFAYPNANQVEVFSAQHPGATGAWADGDEIVTVKTTCTIDTSRMLDKRLFALIDYGIEDWSVADKRLCELSKSKGTTNFVVQGSFLADTSGLNASSTPNYYTSSSAESSTSTITDTGYKNCNGACSPVSASNPALTVNTDDADNPGLYSWEYANHDRYPGEWFTPALLDGQIGVVYIQTQLGGLAQAFPTYIDAYWRIRYAANGDFVQREYYFGKGLDGTWTLTGTTDDLLRTYMTQQTTTDGWLRTYYKVGAAGRHNSAWFDGDDQIDRTVQSHFLNGKLDSVTVCKDGGDNSVPSADDDCRTARFIY